MAIVSRNRNNTISIETKPYDPPQPKHRLHFPNIEAPVACVSKPEVMCASPMREENEAQHKHRHEKIILPDHDALLLLFPLNKNSMPLRTGERCDGGNPCG
jgi:hypothetical protein